MKYFIDLKTLEIKDSLPGVTAAYFQTEHLTLAFTELNAGAEIPLRQAHFYTPGYRQASFVRPTANKSLKEKISYDFKLTIRTKKNK